DLVFVAGQMSVDADGGLLAPGDVRAQARNVFEGMAAELEEAGGSLDDLVELMTFHDDCRQIDAVFEVGREYLGPEFPAWTPVAMNGASVRGALVVARAIAHLGAGEKLCLVPDTIAWWRRHPVSAGCRKGGLLCVAGQYGTDADGNVNTPGDHGGQTRNALNRLKEICGLAGGSLDDVIDVWSFHQDPRGIEPCTEV